MQVKTIELNNYRNYNNVLVNFNNGLNVLVGKNAQGKSPRVSKDKDLINWQKATANIKIDVVKQSGKKHIEIYLFKNQNKSIKINGVPILRISELLGEINAIYFSPDDLKLVKESPEERRRFMDIDLSQFNKNYFYALNNYNKVLQQRNKLIKTSGSLSVLKETIEIWNESLAKFGAYIIVKRQQLIEKLTKHASHYEKFLTEGLEDISLTYSCPEGTEDTIKQSLLTSLKNSVEKDYSLGYTTVGPHRDDFKIEVNGIDIRHFGSQGQQRTATLSLKLAELEVFKEHFNECPVLLLDDVLSELDVKRKEMLLNLSVNFQTILTCTEFNFNVPHTKFEINSGEIIKTEENV